MKIKTFSLLVLAAVITGLSGCANSNSNFAGDLLNTLLASSDGGVTKNEIAAAFKQALQMGSDEVTQSLGRTDGFNKDPAVHIKLPESLDPVKNALSKVGLSGPVNTLETKLNRAAEAATPKAKALFVKAISEMTFDDIMEIYNGPPDSATQYFRKKMSPELSSQMTPIVDKSLAEVGAINTFNSVMQKYDAIPFAPKVDSDITGHVVNGAMDGLFHYMAQEEQAIREDPVKQTTALLKKVFGSGR